jgi:hypothetical protein
MTSQVALRIYYGTDNLKNMRFEQYHGSAFCQALVFALKAYWTLLPRSSVGKSGPMLALVLRNRARALPGRIVNLLRIAQPIRSAKKMLQLGSQLSEIQQVRYKTASI